MKTRKMANDVDLETGPLANALGSDPVAETDDPEIDAPETGDPEIVAPEIGGPVTVLAIAAGRATVPENGPDRMVVVRGGHAHVVETKTRRVAPVPEIDGIESRAREIAETRKRIKIRTRIGIRIETSTRTRKRIERRIDLARETALKRIRIRKKKIVRTNLMMRALEIVRSMIRARK